MRRREKKKKILILREIMDYIALF